MFHVLREGSENSNFSQLQIFHKLGTGGEGSSNFKFFPTSKKSKIFLVSAPNRRDRVKCSALLESLIIKKFFVGGGLVVLSDFSGKLET